MNVQGPSAPSDWEEITPLRIIALPPPPGLPLIRRTSPVPLAEGLRPVLSLKYRDLLVMAPWAICIGVVTGRLGGQIPAAGVLGAVFGVFFDRVMRRWI